MIRHFDQQRAASLCLQQGGAAATVAEEEQDDESSSVLVAAAAAEEFSSSSSSSTAASPSSLSLLLPPLSSGSSSVDGEQAHHTCSSLVLAASAAAAVEDRLGGKMLLTVHIGQHIGGHEQQRRTSSKYAGEPTQTLEAVRAKICSPKRGFLDAAVYAFETMTGVPLPLTTRLADLPDTQLRLVTVHSGSTTDQLLACWPSSASVASPTAAASPSSSQTHEYVLIAAATANAAEDSNVPLDPRHASYDALVAAEAIAGRHEQRFVRIVASIGEQLDALKRLTHDWRAGHATVVRTWPAELQRVLDQLSADHAAAAQRIADVLETTEAKNRRAFSHIFQTVGQRL